MKRLILITFLISASVLGQTQSNSQFSSWNSLKLKGHLDSHFCLKSEFNFRRTNFLNDWEQIMIRPSLNYQLNDNLKFSLGYTHSRNYSFSNYSIPENLLEDNIWQQALFGFDFGKVEFKNRFRIEERFREYIDESNDQPAGSRNYSNRLRYRFITVLPLYPKLGISAVLYDEIFFGFRKMQEINTPDQNWVYIGLQYPLNDNLKLSSGYHYIDKMGKPTGINNHIWETSITFNIN